MAHAIDPEREVATEIRRVVVGSLRQAAKELADGPTEPAVHRARKSCKRARAAVDLAAKGLWVGTGERLDRMIRDAARHLGDVRDGDVMRGWVKELGLDARLGEVPDREARGRSAVTGLDAALRFAESLAFGAVDGGTLISGLGRSWSRARGALRAATAEPTAESLHEWRKRTKRLMYQSELVSELYPEVVPVTTLLDTLQEELGTHHDLWVLHTVSPDPQLLARAAAIEPHVVAAGTWLFRASGRAFAEWLATRP